MSAPILDSKDFDLAAARDVLARLERYAASVRGEVRSPLAAPAAPAPKHPMAAATLQRPDVRNAPLPWPHLQETDVRRARSPESENLKPGTHRRRINPATADLFPYDLSASIVACALIIMAYISVGRPLAIAATAAIAVGGELMRRFRWFPSVGVKLLIGTVFGLVLVFMS